LRIRIIKDMWNQWEWWTGIFFAERIHWNLNCPLPGPNRFSFDLWDQARPH